MRIFFRLFLQYLHRNHAILLRSTISYYDMTAYISLTFSDGQRTLKESEIKKETFKFNSRLDCYLLLIFENQCSETKKIHKACKAEIEELKRLLDSVIIYE